jgi:putative ABC transport system ATP-binding protein
MTTSVGVEFHDVTKGFARGGQQITVVEKVTLQIRPGDFVALMGPSGSGKSTILNLIAGLDGPDSGRVLVGGVDPTQMSDSARCDWRARNLGFIFQKYHLLEVLTAAENVEVPLLLTRLSRAERKRRVQVALEVVGVADRAGHYPRMLSGGQEQRVAIARAIASDPSLLLADEPTGDLDARSASEIMELLSALNKRLGKTIVMVTHDPKAALRATRCLHLEKGRLLAA